MVKDEKVPADQVVRDIRRETRRKYGAEEKICIVLEGLRGEDNITELYRRENRRLSKYHQSLYDRFNISVFMLISCSTVVWNFHFNKHRMNEFRLLA